MSEKSKNDSKKKPDKKLFEEAYKPFKSDPSLRGQLKWLGIDRNQEDGYDPPYTDLDGWKLGPGAPVHRDIGEKASERPKELVHPPGKPPKTPEERYQLRRCSYNRHAENDRIANIFKGIKKKRRNCTTTIYHHHKHRSLTMSKIANIQQRRRKVAQLLLEGGHSYRDMADMLGVSAATISRDVEALDTIWREEMADAVDTVRNRLIKRKEYQMREAKDAWERSKLKKRKEKKKHSKSKKKGQGKVEELTVMEEEQNGDPRFLELFGEAAVDIATFQGVDRKQFTKFEINILPPLPEEKFGRYGIGAGDYENAKDQDFDQIKYDMAGGEERRAMRLEVSDPNSKIVDADYEDLPEDESTDEEE